MGRWAGDAVGHSGLWVHEFHDGDGTARNVYAGLGHFPPAEYTSDRVTALIFGTRATMV
jgi:hypothetical protein